MEKPRLVPSTVSALRSGQEMDLWGLERRTEKFSPGNFLEEGVGEGVREGPGVGQGSEEILPREGVRGWRDS